MATSVQLPIADYLQRSYRPDREYVDGELVERNMGTWEHGRIQGLLCGWFLAHEVEWGVLFAPEWRARVSPTRVRIPDLTVVLAGPQPAVLVHPPLLVVEILSPDDTFTETQHKAQDYLNMGLNAIWIVDPATRTGRMYLGTGWSEVTHLEVPGTPIFLDLPTLFASLHPTSS